MLCPDGSFIFRIVSFPRVSLKKLTFYIFSIELSLIDSGSVMVQIIVAYLTLLFAFIWNSPTSSGGQKET